MDRAALRAAAMGEKKAGRGGGDAAAADGGPGAAASRALQQCGQLQKLIDISIGSLRGLRTKCAVSNDLTQQEIRTLEVRGPRGPGSGPGTSLDAPGHSFPDASWSRCRPFEASSPSSSRCCGSLGTQDQPVTLGGIWGEGRSGNWGGGSRSPWAGWAARGHPLPPHLRPRPVCGAAGLILPLSHTLDFSLCD